MKGTRWGALFQCFGTGLTHQTSQQRRDTVTPVAQPKSNQNDLCSAATNNLQAEVDEAQDAAAVFVPTRSPETASCCKDDGCAHDHPATPSRQDDEATCAVVSAVQPSMALPTTHPRNSLAPSGSVTGELASSDMLPAQLQEQLSNGSAPAAQHAALPPRACAQHSKQGEPMVSGIATQLPGPEAAWVEDQHVLALQRSDCPLSNSSQLAAPTAHAPAPAAHPSGALPARSCPATQHTKTHASEHMQHLEVRQREGGPSSPSYQPITAPKLFKLSSQNARAQQQAAATLHGVMAGTAPSCDDGADEQLQEDCTHVTTAVEAAAAAVLLAAPASAPQVIALGKLTSASHSEAPPWGAGPGSGADSVAWVVQQISSRLSRSNIEDATLTHMLYSSPLYVTAGAGSVTRSTCNGSCVLNRSTDLDGCRSSRLLSVVVPPSPQVPSSSAGPSTFTGPITSTTTMTHLCPATNDNGPPTGHGHSLDIMASLLPYPLCFKSNTSASLTHMHTLIESNGSTPSSSNSMSSYPSVSEDLQQVA